MKRTPLPWKLVQHKEGKGMGANTFIGWNVLGNDATELEEYETLIMNTDNKKDAVFVVSAVNSHDDLVDALELLLKCADRKAVPMKTGIVYLKAKRALTKAKAAP